MEVAGQMVQGGQNIFFAQLADSANIAHFSADATRYFSGEFIFMIFGLPGAALAMYHCAKPEKKKAAVGVRGIRMAEDDAVEHAYLLASRMDYTITYHDKEISLTAKIKLAKRDTKGTKIRV